MQSIALKLLTDKASRQGAATSEVAVQLAATFSPWANVADGVE